MQLTHRIFLPLFFILSGLLQAALTLNSARPITHQVTIHPIRVFTDDGSTGATYFGNISQKNDIIEKINQIWGQLGVSVVFLPEETFNDSFSYDNNGESHNSYRPSSHLNTIKDDRDAPKTRSKTDIEMFFVEVCPGFRGSDLTLNTAAGRAIIDRSGSTLYIGSNLLGFSNGRDAIAAVVAHEIGHNLGLGHLDSEAANLMAEGSPASEELEDDQLETIFKNTSGVVDGYNMLIPVPDTNLYDDFVERYDLRLGPTGDDDGDALSNLLEYAIGTDPTTPGTLPVMVKSPGNPASWTIPKSEDAEEEGVTYTVMVSSDLIHYHEAGSAGSHTEVATDSATTLTVLFNGAGPFFAKLFVQRPTP